MARTQIFDGIFATLQADPVLPTLLGPSVAQNPRIMRGYPQLQSLLASGYEPATSDAWLVFLEPNPYLRVVTDNLETTFEVLEIQFGIYAVQYRVADDVMDVLDQYWQWSIAQQRDIQYGERILLQSRRFRVEETYAQEVKLPQKSLFYRMAFTLETQHA